MAQVDFSPIGDLYNTYRQARSQAEAEAALGPLRNSTDAASYDRAARALLASGNLQGGIALAQLAQKYGDKDAALRLSQSFSGMFTQPQQQPTARPASNSPDIESGPDMRLPRGLRNNNPLNIEAGDFTQSQPGFVGSDGRFARFQTPEQGIQAASTLLDTYQNKYGLNTVRGIISRWAPQGENDTNGYVTSVAGRLGVDPDQPLTPEQRQPLIQAMARFENGRPLTSQAAVAPAGSATPQSGAPQAANTPWPAAPQNGKPQAPQAMFAGRPMDQWIPMMMGIATHPNAPPEVQKVAMEFVKGAQQEAGLTADQKDYRGYIQQGGTDDYTTWLRKNKTAGATLINTAEGEAAAAQKARIQIDTHAIQDLSKKVVSGRSALPLLERVMQLADKTPQGWAGAVSPTIAKAISSLGIDVPEGISNAELFGSISRQFVPAVRDPGATSNYEQSLYMSAVPALSQSADGRKKIAEMMRSQIQRNSEILQIYRQNVGSPDLDKKLAELDNKPLFTPENRKYLETVVAQASPQDEGGVAPQEQPQGNPYEAEMRRRGLLK